MRLDSSLRVRSKRPWLGIAYLPFRLALKEQETRLVKAFAGKRLSLDSELGESEFKTKLTSLLPWPAFKQASNCS